MRSRSLGGLLALAGLGACALPPEGVEEAQLAAYDAAVASVGCELRNERHYLAVEIQTGLTRAHIFEVSRYKIDTEAARRLESGGVRLVTGPCASEPAAPAMAGDAGTGEAG